MVKNGDTMRLSWPQIKLGLSIITTNFLLFFGFSRRPLKKVPPILSRMAHNLAKVLSGGGGDMKGYGNVTEGKGGTSRPGS